MTGVRNKHHRAVRLDMLAFATAIEDRRQVDGRSFVALAAALGLTSPTFTRIRNAAVAEALDESETAESIRIRTGYRPDVETFLSICEWLGVPPGDFARGTK